MNIKDFSIGNLIEFEKAVCIISGLICAELISISYLNGEKKG